MSQRSTAQHCHIDTPFCTICKSHVTWNFAVPKPHSEEIRRCILLFLCTRVLLLPSLLPWTVRDLGTVTRPPSNIYARVNCSIIRHRCTRVQGHPRNLFRRPWIFGLSSLKHHTWPCHASVLWYTEENFSFQMQQRKFPRPYLRNDTMDFHF